MSDHGARSAEARWGRFAMPPFDGCINSIQGDSAERFLDVVCQPAKGIAERHSI